MKTNISQVFSRLKMSSKYSLAVLFGMILMVGGSSYAALTNGTPQNLDDGEVLESENWNSVSGGVNELHQRTEPITNSGGNIGIGRTDPMQKLDVNGSIRVSEDIIHTEGTPLDIRATDANGSVRVYTGADDNLGLVQASNGNVGIGTTTPNAELDVEGTLKVNNPNATYGNNTTGNLGNVIIGSEGKIHDMAGYYMALSHNIDWDETNGFKYINAGPAARIELGGWTSTGESHIAFEVPPTSSGPSIIGGMDPEHRKMVIKSNGAVGIGTTTPKSRLSVNGDIDVFQSDKFAKIMLDSGSSTKTLSIHYGTDPDSVDATNQLRFGRYGDNLGAWEATPVRFDMDAPNGSLLLSDSGNLLVNNGNMGIGIVSPQAKLDVGGEGYFGSTNKLKIHENNGGLSVQGTLATDDSQKKNIFLNAWGGNVGIGTTDPQAKLDVNGGIRVTPLASAPSACNADTKGLFYFDNTQGILICDGTNWNAFRGPQGVQGPQGAKGDKGDRGAQGPIGTGIQTVQASVHVLYAHHKSCNTGDGIADHLELMSCIAACNRICTNTCNGSNDNGPRLCGGGQTSYAYRAGTMVETMPDSSTCGCWY